MSSNQFPGTGIESLRAELESADTHHPGGQVVTVLREDLRALLTPPPDAAVREAAECLTSGLGTVTKSDGPFWNDMAGYARTILSYVRAVQAPRLNPEHVDRLREAADTLEAHGEVLEAQWLRAAFPDAFAGEATDKSVFECLVGLTFTKSEDSEDE